MRKSDGFVGFWATGSYAMYLVFVPVFELVFFCVFNGFVLYGACVGIAAKAGLSRGVFVLLLIFLAFGFVLFYYSKHSAYAAVLSNIILKNNVLTLTTGPETIYKLENIEDIKFRYSLPHIHVRVNGRNIKSERGKLYIETVGEASYKAYSVQLRPTIGEIETLVYLIHMIKQRELDTLTEVTPEYIAALRRKYILSELDTIKTDRKEGVFF
ncbi:hypothetical protein FACS1894198_4090 [Clostridia bacterium]|nr:hypothetical protein FACS1894198_4090 [Clostridia bacterium]